MKRLLASKQMLHYIFNKSIVMVMLITLLTGCGFHLRGNYSFHTSMQELYMTPDDPLEPLQKIVCRMLQRNHVTVHPGLVRDPKKTNSLPILYLTNPNYSDHILATTADSKTQRIKMIMSFSYHLTLNNKPLRENTTITISRDLTVSPTTPLSNESESRSIKDELLREGANQLLRQLSTISGKLNQH